MPELFQRQIKKELITSSQSYPVVTILGPRQSGKTTLAKLTFPDKPYVNLETPDERELALTDPKRFLAQFPEGAIFDEIQRVPQLLSYIQAWVDEKKQPRQYILTGSHQLELQQEVSQSLAGRTGVLHLYPLSLYELQSIRGKYSIDEQLIYGGYPRIYEYDLAPLRFYRDYVQTYLERDLKQIINVKDLDQFRRFMYLCAARVGTLLDYTSFANDLGISRHTVKQWFSVLKASFIIFTLPPYFENFGKQIIKSSKIYFSDVGLLCYLLGVENAVQIARHPLRGLVFENLILTEYMKHRLNRGMDPRMFFYRDNNRNEVDLIVPTGSELLAIEIKSAETFNKQFLKSLYKFNTMVTKQTVQPYLIYAGQQEQTVNEIQLLNYLHLDQLF